MIVNRKKLLVVGDRVLVSPSQGEERTRVGLYLPQAAVEKMAVQSGKIAEVGPGTPVAQPNEHSEEPWKHYDRDGKAQYVPLEAEVGDTALFLRNAAVEIAFEGTDYLIVPHSAILLLVREPAEEPETKEDDDAEFRADDFKL